MNNRSGWIPDIPDSRDIIYSAPLAIATNLPPLVDLRSGPPISDQGDLNSCTANAAASAFRFNLMKQGAPFFDPSRLFIYYNTRMEEGSLPFDGGASLRSTLKTMKNIGCCSETDWPYSITAFAKKPADTLYTAALEHQLLQYSRLAQPSVNQLQACLAEGYPFVFGFTVKDSFLNIGPDGMMPVPASNEGTHGGHAVMAIGYNNDNSTFIIQNSRGPNWGDKGYFYMPYAFITDIWSTRDFWTIRLVEQGVPSV